jgi:hypothetical protein
VVAGSGGFANPVWVVVQAGAASSAVILMML